MKRLIFAFFVFLLAPISVSANVVITEIMYDLEGSDGGREWIEIFNDGNEAVDLSGWRFFENDTNHTLTAYSGDGVLEANSYAIIADKADQFLSDNPEFEGKLFDSSFSLKNTGELIRLQNENELVQDEVMYSSEWGANGDGFSLQKTQNDWLTGFPTPGSAFTGNNAGNDTGTASEAENEGSSQPNHTESAPKGTTPLIEPQIFAEAGKDRNVVVGADTLFEGEAIGIEGKPLQSARHSWNFGNGETKEGKRVFHNYNYPGKYIVVLSVSSGEYSASDKIYVTAEPADIIISNTSSEFIELFNRGNKELNLSWWQLQWGNQYFTLSENTIILPDSSVRFSNTVTGFLEKSVLPKLLYPNGVIAYEKPVATEESNNIENNDFSPKEVIIPETPVAETKEETFLLKQHIYEENAPAAVYSVKNKEEYGAYKWLLALLGIIIISLISFFIMRHEEKRLTHGMEIIEE